MAGLFISLSWALAGTGLSLSLLVRSPVAIATAAVATISAWFRFVDIQGASVQFLAIQATDGGDGLVFCGHLDKCESFRLAAVPVGNDLNG